MLGHRNLVVLEWRCRQSIPTDWDGKVLTALLPLPGTGSKSFGSHSMYQVRCGYPISTFFSMKTKKQSQQRDSKPICCPWGLKQTIHVPHWHRTSKISGLLEPAILPLFMLAQGEDFFVGCHLSTSTYDNGKEKTNICNTAPPTKKILLQWFSEAMVPSQKFRLGR